MSMVVDEHGELTVEPRTEGPSQLTISPGLRLSEPSCGVPTLGRSKHVPVLVGFQELSPLVNPALWTQFTSLVMTDQVITGSCPLGMTGWTGTIVETMTLELFGVKNVVRNRLNIEFCEEPRCSRAKFSLNQCFEGGITFDSGYVEATPTALGLGELYAEKALDWAPGSMPCFFPHAVNELILSTALTLGVIEYSVKVTELIAERGAHTLRRELGQRLGELGFDLDAGRLLPHFF